MHTIRKFGLGYAPDKWDGLLKHLRSQGFSLTELYEAGLVRKGQKNNYYDFFRNRVMTPIIDVRGNGVAFGGRVLDDRKTEDINTNAALGYKKNKKDFRQKYTTHSGKKEIILW